MRETCEEPTPAATTRARRILASAICWQVADEELVATWSMGSSLGGPRRRNSPPKVGLLYVHRPPHLAESCRISAKFGQTQVDVDQLWSTSARVGPISAFGQIVEFGGKPAETTQKTGPDFVEVVFAVRLDWRSQYVHRARGCSRAMAARRECVPSSSMAGFYFRRTCVHRYFCGVPSDGPVGRGRSGENVSGICPRHPPCGARVNLLAICCAM